MQILWESEDKKKVLTWFFSFKENQIHLVLCEKLIPDNDWGYDNLNNEKIITIAELMEMLFFIFKWSLVNKICLLLGE